jgi:acetyl-CoA acetyltransferase
VVGVGESEYFKHGQSPRSEFRLCLDAVLAACRDAGISPDSIDGLVSYASDRTPPARLSAALGMREWRWCGVEAGGGGGGGVGAIQQAALAVASGVASCVLVYHAVAQGQSRRRGHAIPRRQRDSYWVPFGLQSAAQLYALRVQRFFHETSVSPATQRSVALASYAHAQNNPRAVMNGRPLTVEKYESSRWIAEPFRLYDCCLESDGAAAVIVTRRELAESGDKPAAYILSAAHGSGYRAGGILEGVLDPENFGTAEFSDLAGRAYAASGLTPADVDCAQIYENFTGGVVMAIIELGFCSVADANSFIVEENLLAAGGSLPLNTSGGNLAEAYVHGMEMHPEAVRQIRGTADNQVAGAQVCLTASAPMVAPTGLILYGSKDALG